MVGGRNVVVVGFLDRAGIDGRERERERACENERKSNKWYWLFHLNVVYPEVVRVRRTMETYLRLEKNTWFVGLSLIASE